MTKIVIRKKIKSDNGKSKILFIAPYDYTLFSIRILQSFIKSKGYNTHTIFFKELKLNQLKKPTKKEKDLLITKIKQINPQVICISFRSPLMDIIKEITALIKNNSKSIVIWGGVHPTICPEECIKYADYVCVGEGELSLLEFIQNLEQNKPVDNIKNFYPNKLRPLLKNLDELPMPDYSIENKYFIEDNKLRKGDPILNNSKYFTMVGRGCPFACSYCINSYYRKLHKKDYIRKRSVASVMNELFYVKKVFKNLKTISFLDEVFVLDKEWLKQFVKEYKQKINIPFKCELHPSMVHEETIKILKEAGLTRIDMGIQSGSQRVRYEIYNRLTPDKQIINSANIFKKYNITPHYDIILDNPYETREDMQQSIKMLLKLPRPFNLNLYSLVSFPKTELTERLIRDSILDKSDESKALSQWCMSLKFKRDKNHLYYNCLVSLLSKSFVPKNMIKTFSKSYFLRKHVEILVGFTELCNKIKLASTGIILIFTGKISYSTFKYNLKIFNEMVN